MTKELESMNTANFILKNRSNITPRKLTLLANVTQMRSAKKTKWLQLVTALIILPFTINITHATLSATTAQTIKGSPPYFALNGTPLISSAELVGFSYGTTFVDTSQSTQVNAGNIITLPAGTTEGDIKAAVAFNQSTATPLRTLVQMASHPLKVVDSDGDADNTTLMDAMGTIQATFTKDGKSVLAGSSALLNPCVDYEINVTVTGTGTPPEVTAKTTYGDPNISAAGTYSGITATYKLLSSDKGICYLRPQNMTVNPAGVLADQYHSATGYNPAQWVAGQGFKVSAGFPSSGFKGAVFSVIGSGTDQSHYKCTVTGGGNLAASTPAATTSLGEGCKFTMTSTNRPTTADTITLWDTTGGTSTSIDTYVIDYSTGLWAFGPKTTAQYNTEGNGTGSYNASNICGGTPVSNGLANRGQADLKFFYLFEFVKTPITDSTGSGQHPFRPGASPYISRMTGGFSNEWGYLGDYSAGPFAPIGSENWTANTAWYSGAIDQSRDQYTYSEKLWIQAYVALSGSQIQNMYYPICRG